MPPTPTQAPTGPTVTFTAHVGLSDPDGKNYSQFGESTSHTTVDAGGNQTLVVTICSSCPAQTITAGAPPSSPRQVVPHLPPWMNDLCRGLVANDSAETPILSSPTGAVVEWQVSGERGIASDLRQLGRTGRSVVRESLSRRQRSPPGRFTWEWLGHLS